MAPGSAAWHVILPVAKTNLIDGNPSYERGTTGAFAIQSATLGSVASKQQFGAWSLSVTPNSNGTSGCVAGTWSAGLGTAYTVSAYVNGAVGVPYMIGVGQGAGLALVGSTAFVGGGTWQRYSFSYTEAAGATRDVTIRKTSGNNTDPFYIDGVQAEVGSITTYLDGDQEGCGWRGAPHQSLSTRSSQSRAGGSVVSLASLGMILEHNIGVGMPPVQNDSQSFANLPGAAFQGQRATERPFVLTCTFLGTTQQDFHVTRARVIDALKIDAVTPQQPCRFLYTGGLGTVQIDAVYEGGLGLNLMNGPMAEKAPIQFVAPYPYWKSTTDEGTALAPRASIGSTNYIAYRDPLGRWGTMGVNGSTLGAGAAGLVQAWSVLPIDSGTVLVGGIFGSAGGTFVSGLARYNPSLNTWGTLQGGSFTATPGAPTIFKLLRTPTGTVVIGGDFVTVGGTACKALCFWHGAYGTFVGGTVGGGYIQDLAYNGTLFFGGSIGGPIGGTAQRHIGIHVNNAFGTLKNGTVNDIVEALVIDRQQRLIATGFFTQVAGTTANGVAQHADGSWGTMHTGIINSTAGHALLIGMDGKPHVGGQFLQASSGSANGGAAWNGIIWDAMGDGVQGPSSPGIFALMQDKKTSLIWAGGLFGTAGSVPTSDGLAVFNGYSWLSPDIQIDPASGTIYDLAQSVDGTIYACGDFSGTARVASVAQVMNSGKTDVQPIVKMRNTGAGTARLYQLLNTLTNDAIYFNYVMLAGEEMTLDIAERTFTSDYRDSQFAAMVPGASIAFWKLQSGTNWVSLFTDSDSVQTAIYWRPTHWSSDGGTVY